jgi:hypothetical protein
MDELWYGHYCSLAANVRLSTEMSVLTIRHNASYEPAKTAAHRLLLAHGLAVT